MTSPLWHRRALAAPFAILFLGTLVGGQLNRVDARGRIIDDTSGQPVADVTVSFGSRATVTDASGHYEMDNLPRGTKLDTQQRYYGRHPVAAEATELRIVPLTITLEVHDAFTAKGVETPEARQPADTQIGKGTTSGEMVVGPYPDRGSKVLICAKDYAGVEITPVGYQMNVDLTPSKGSDCPALKSPPPPAQTPSPSPSAPGSPSGSGAPSASPRSSATP
jgi:hypothetical protein